jgi:hypothetical protein
MEAERTAVTYPELKLRITKEPSPDVSSHVKADEPQQSQVTSLILAAGWPNVLSKEPMALVRDIAKLRDSGQNGPWIVMDR